MPPRNRRKGNRLWGSGGAAPRPSWWPPGPLLRDPWRHPEALDPRPVGVGSPRGFKQKVLWFMTIF